jgi:hypothetical protein
MQMPPPHWRTVNPEAVAKAAIASARRGFSRGGARGPAKMRQNGITAVDNAMTLT